jgi:hypothetical protein
MKNLIIHRKRVSKKKKIVPKKANIANPVNLSISKGDANEPVTTHIQRHIKPKMSEKTIDLLSNMITPDLRIYSILS